MRYFLKSKRSVNQDAEPYDDKIHLMARLQGVTDLSEFIIVIVDRISKPNLVCDIKEYGNGLWLSAFDDDTMRTIFDDQVPSAYDLDGLMELIIELEQK